MFVEQRAARFAGIPTIVRPWKHGPPDSELPGPGHPLNHVKSQGERFKRMMVGMKKSLGLMPLLPFLIFFCPPLLQLRTTRLPGTPLGRDGLSVHGPCHHPQDLVPCPEAPGVCVCVCVCVCAFGPLLLFLHARLYCRRILEGVEVEILLLFILTTLIMKHPRCPGVFSSDVCLRDDW